MSVNPLAAINLALFLLHSSQKNDSKDHNIDKMMVLYTLTNYGGVFGEDEASLNANYSISQMPQVKNGEKHRTQSELSLAKEFLA